MGGAGATADALARGRGFVLFASSASHERLTRIRQLRRCVRVRIHGFGEHGWVIRGSSSNGAPRAVGRPTQIPQFVNAGVVWQGPAGKWTAEMQEVRTGNITEIGELAAIDDTVLSAPALDPAGSVAYIAGFSPSRLKSSVTSFT